MSRANDQWYHRYVLAARYLLIRKTMSYWEINICQEKESHLTDLSYSPLDQWSTSIRCSIHFLEVVLWVGNVLCHHFVTNVISEHTKPLHKKHNVNDFSTWSSHLVTILYPQIYPSEPWCTHCFVGMVWYGIVEFNVSLNTVQVISETGDPEQWCVSLGNRKCCQPIKTLLEQLCKRSGLIQQKLKVTQQCHKHQRSRNNCNI